MDGDPGFTEKGGGRKDAVSHVRSSVELDPFLSATKIINFSLLGNKSSPSRRCRRTWSCQILSRRQRLPTYTLCAYIYDALSTSHAAMMDPSDTKNDGRLFGNIVYEGIRPSITDDDFEPPQQVASPNSPIPPPRPPFLTSRVRCLSVADFHESAHFRQPPRPLAALSL